MPHGSPLGAGLHINILLIIAFLLGGCNIKDPIATPPIENPDYSIIDGDTVKTVKTKNYDKMYGRLKNKHLVVVGDTIITFKEPKLHTAPAKDPDLAKIKNDKELTLKGKPLTMVVVGGSLSAGVRDGGYFNEGIITSYPSMVAKQMKLKKFEQPLFDAAEYNGIGRKVKTGFNPTGGPLQKYKIVQNNLSGIYDNADPYIKLKLTKYKGDADNLAIPFNNRSFIDTDGFGIEPFRDRILNKNEKNETFSIKNHLKTKKFDFFVVETGIDDAIAFLTSGSSRIWSASQNEIDYTNNYPQNCMYCQPELKLIGEVLAPLGAKGVFLNIPDVLDFPFFLNKEWVENYDPLIKPYLRDYGILDIAYSYLQSSKVDSILSPKVHISLKPITPTKRLVDGKDYTLKDDFTFGVKYLNGAIERMNGQLLSFNKKYGYPIVDIRRVYKSITSATGFKADDGTLINTKNFFSSDGINPTPLGQAVIANEVIKTINATYQTQIPLIGMQVYLDVK